MPSPETTLLVSALIFITIGLMSMTYQRDKKISQREKKDESKSFYSLPDVFGAASGCIPGTLGFVFVLFGIVILILLGIAYTQSGLPTEQPTTFMFRSHL